VPSGASFPGKATTRDEVPSGRLITEAYLRQAEPVFRFWL